MSTRPTDPSAEPTFLRKDNNFLGMSAQGWAELERMQLTLQTFNPLQRGPSTMHLSPSSARAANLSTLFHSYPFLTFTSSSRADHACARLVSWLWVWRAAHRHLGTSCTPDETRAADAFLGFVADYAAGRYNHFLPPPRRSRDDARADARAGRMQALDGFWVWIQRHKEGLTWGQFGDMQRLQDWVVQEKRGGRERGA